PILHRGRGSLGWAGSGICLPGVSPSPAGTARPPGHADRFSPVLGRARSGAGRPGQDRHRRGAASWAPAVTANGSRTVPCAGADVIDARTQSGAAGTARGRREVAAFIPTGRRPWAWLG